VPAALGQLWVAPVACDFQGADCARVARVCQVDEGQELQVPQCIQGFAESIETSQMEFEEVEKSVSVARRKASTGRKGDYRPQFSIA